MATFKELADLYLRELKSAPDQRRAADQVLRQIKELVYADSRQPLSLVDKRQILQYMKDQVPVDIAIKEADNVSYLALIDYIMQKLEG